MNQKRANATFHVALARIHQNLIASLRFHSKYRGNRENEFAGKSSGLWIIALTVFPVFTSDIVCRGSPNTAAAPCGSLTRFLIMRFQNGTCTCTPIKAQIPYSVKYVFVNWSACFRVLHPRISMAIKKRSCGRLSPCGNSHRITRRVQDL